MAIVLLAGVTVSQSEPGDVAQCCQDVPDPLEPLITQGREIALWAQGIEPATGEQRARWARSADPLVRTWIKAANIQRAADFDALEVSALACAGESSLTRPLSLRWRALEAQGQTARLEQTLRIVARQPLLGPELLPSIVQRDLDEIVTVMLTASGDDVRRTAAGVCASAAGERRDDVAWAVLSELSCRPEATQVPWAGGALFVPGLGWTASEARLLASELVGWLVLSETRGWSGETSKIVTNLGSFGLANAAGYPLRGAADGRSWLVCWRETYGRDALMSLMIRLRITRDPRYADLWR